MCVSINKTWIVGRSSAVLSRTQVLTWNDAAVGRINVRIDQHALKLLGDSIIISNGHNLFTRVIVIRLWMAIESCGCFLQRWIRGS